ncbi:MAG: hypothetical protein ACRCZ2_13860 [Fusobacteriaceae bacterium]
MTITAKKEAAEKLREKLEKANGKEPANFREMANDIATLERVAQKELAGDPVPTGYDSYLHWTEEVEKQIDSKAKSLERIEDQKLMIEVMDFYIATA